MTNQIIKQLRTSKKIIIRNNQYLIKPMKSHPKEPKTSPGVFKVLLQDLQIQSKTIGNLQNLHLNLRLGSQSYDQRLLYNSEAQTFSISNKEFLFERKLEESLIFQIHQQKSSQNHSQKQSQAEQQRQISTNTAFGSLLLTPFILMKNLNHEVTLHLVQRTPKKLILKTLSPQQKVFKAVKSGIIVLTIRYLPDFIGKLFVRVKNAHLKRDTAAFGNMKPLVKLQLGGQVSQTVCGQGVYPCWQDSCFQFQVRSPLQFLYLKVVDKFVINKDLIGECWVDWSHLGVKNFEKQFLACKFPLHYLQQKDVGTIDVELKVTQLSNSD